MNIFLALITHPNSKYLDESGQSVKYQELKEILNIDNELTYVRNQQTNYINDLNIFKKLISLKNFIKLIFKVTIRIQVKNKSLKSLFWSLINNTINSLNITKIIVKDVIFKRKNLDTYINRQINISASHIKCFQEALKTNCKWAIVVEDDIFWTDQEKVRNGIEFAINQMDELNLNILNLSESFHDIELGINNLRKYEILHPTDNIKLIKYKEINTNTSCATLYRISILNKVLTKMNNNKKDDIIPIDYKLNEALNELVKENAIQADSYGQVKPGLIIQLSLR